MGMWAATRLRYPAKVRRWVDAMVTGKASLMDVAGHAFGRFLMTEDLIDEVKAERKAARSGDGERDHEAPGLRSITLLEAVAARYLDQWRQIVNAMGPALTANDQPVRLPIGMTEPEMRARVAALEEQEIIN